MNILPIKTIEYERPAGFGSCTAEAWARTPAAPTAAEKTALKERIKRLLKEREAVLVAHYYVDADLHGRVSLTMAASHARLSPNYFSRCFRQAFGVTFSRFVAGRRVERAQGLMIAGADRLCQIALACGFADQAHFTRTFGHLLGCTPARWRRQAVIHRLPVKPAAGAHQDHRVLLGNLEFRAAHS